MNKEDINEFKDKQISSLKLKFNVIFKNIIKIEFKNKIYRNIAKN